MATPLRAVRPRQAFAATAPKAPPARMLHMTGTQNQPSSYLAFQNRVAELGRKTEKKPVKPTESRPFNTHRALQKRGDSSPIDMCYFPSREAPENLDAVLPQIPVIPLTPTAPRPAKMSDLQLGEPHADDPAETLPRVISTSSGLDIDEGRVQAVTETDAHASDADAGWVVGLNKEKGKSEFKSFLDGFMDDLLGPKGKVA